MGTAWMNRRRPATSFPTIPNGGKTGSPRPLPLRADLSKDCGLAACADGVRVGGGCMGLAMVFTGVSVGTTSITRRNWRKSWWNSSSSPLRSWKHTVLVRFYLTLRGRLK